MNKYFKIENIDNLDNIVNKYKENDNISLVARDVFYKKWRDYLLRKMEPNEIYDFFEDASVFWTLMQLKKNIFSEDCDEFNECLNILRNENISLLERFSNVCDKTNGINILKGIGPGITSTMLSILYPDSCIVYNNASNDFLNYFNIEKTNFKGKKAEDKYYQYILFSKILMEKYKFKNLIEVDCFIGYVKINYLRKQT